MKVTTTLAAALMLFAGSAYAQTSSESVLAKADINRDVKDASGAFSGSKLAYTTYFYTATEAIIHGYEKDTNVRIVSLAQNRTIWQGKVGPGETQLVPTGTGVFGLLSDKKTSLLVGTPSSCTVVGYWLRDEDGMHVADHFYGRVPVSGSADDRVIVWAWDDMNVQITDVTADKALVSQKVKKGEFVEIARPKLQELGGHVLEFRADKKNMAVQVYYDEGFFVPGPDGRTAGKLFHTYVGNITEGVNDLNLIAYHQAANITVKDIKSGEKIFGGKLEPGQIKTLTLSQKYVEIRSDVEISALVAPYEHYKAGYAEHHYGAGVEGTGIDNEFLITTPDELWIFSYYDNNHVQVIDEKTKKTVWTGDLKAGHVQGLTPGYGYFRVKTSAAVSVMGGDQACGAEYSPAAGLFKVDEELLKVATEILQERRDAAAAEGRTLTEQEANAPLSAEENAKVRRKLKKSLKRPMSADEVNERMGKMVTY